MTPSPSPAGRAFARLSTSAKILIILTLALLPLGLIASLASLETAKANRVNREAAARLLATDGAERFNLAIDHAAALLHSAQRQGRTGCSQAADALGRGAVVALFGAEGRLICASSALTATLPLRPAAGSQLVTLDSEAQALRLVTGTAGVQGWALAQLPGAVLAEQIHPGAIAGSYALTLHDLAGHTLTVAALQSAPLGRTTLTAIPVAGKQLKLSMTVADTPLSANEILITLLPILMWAAAAAIGWLVVDRLILRPLADMREAMDAYHLSGRFELPVLTTPAFEIQLLGRAFARMTGTITRHEAELEEGLARQTRLTREVHHRVKNNLQVVASLLNIHARGATAREAADAYATIQRRVDALALVHRSHYAELEVNHGIALRPLVGELAANLRGSLGPDIRPPVITLHLELFHANQDTAASVAFLLVEMIETAMRRVPGSPITITLEAVPGKTDRARLAVLSPALRPDAAMIDGPFEMFERVTTGLSRQLRSPLERDDAVGLLAIEIAVIVHAA
jgi:two-component sensor histidine kinase